MQYDNRFISLPSQWYVMEPSRSHVIRQTIKKWSNYKYCKEYIFQGVGNQPFKSSLSLRDLHPLQQCPTHSNKQ